MLEKQSQRRHTTYTRKQIIQIYRKTNENEANKLLILGNNCDSWIYYGIQGYTSVLDPVLMYNGMYALPRNIISYSRALVFTVHSLCAYITKSYRSENFPLRIRLESATRLHHFSTLLSGERKREIEKVRRGGGEGGTRDGIARTDCTYLKSLN